MVEDAWVPGGILACHSFGNSAGICMAMGADRVFRIFNRCDFFPVLCPQSDAGYRAIFSFFNAFVDDRRFVLGELAVERGYKIFGG
jgi:hypothetical protein